MARQITDYIEANELFSILGSTAGRQVQGSLFAPALLPRQLPIFKHGPEEDETPRRHWH